MSLMLGYVHLQTSSPPIVANVKRANLTAFVKSGLSKRLLQEVRVILRAIGSKHSSGLACDMIMGESCTAVSICTCMTLMWSLPLARPTGDTSIDASLCLDISEMSEQCWTHSPQFITCCASTSRQAYCKCQGSQVKASPAAQNDWLYMQFALFKFKRSLSDASLIIWSELERVQNTLTWVLLL